MRKWYSALVRLIFMALALCICVHLSAQAKKRFNGPLKVALAGISHDHVYLLMQHYKAGEVQIIGIAESDPDLIKKFKAQYHLADSLFFPDLPGLLKQKSEQIEVVMAFNANAAHLGVVKDCAPFHVDVMVEKPLATTVKDAEEIVQLSDKYKIQVLTDYETSWYASNQALAVRVKSGEIGPIRKMVAHDGHQGPKEIGCSEAFLHWLTDPKANGAGALFDFGCYGANLMTWMMAGKAPIAVYATTKQIKPKIYPKVDDDATIILDYPEATGIIEASWNWPYSIKDFAVFGKTGYMKAADRNTLGVRGAENESLSQEKLPAPKAPYQDYIPYVTAVLRGALQPGNDLSSLANNLIVVKILSAARQSAKEGRKIYIR
ncbi:MAG TPA: Gfo/Idh/MocA family oxidoreductase [Arachidicoccus sp.]|nr:Gfo/Idh/MocA family oxidoreductase [Arachidicoccus sp.]